MVHIILLFNHIYFNCTLLSSIISSLSHFLFSWKKFLYFYKPTTGTMAGEQSFLSLLQIQCITIALPKSQRCFWGHLESVVTAWFTREELQVWMPWATWATQSEISKLFMLSIFFFLLSVYNLILQEHEHFSYRVSKQTKD